ncbi:MAG TPA: 3-oxoadipate enol-lactonase [Candidatus Krumholzibacteria bacterium]|nr:3-oxoadipate enol-lactonase [Candidatus Krumholzibacteria bacterium]
MPYALVDNTRIFYRLEGRDDAPTLVLAHSLGLDHSLWDRQALDLAEHFRILRFDTRGHGASDAPSGDYTIERLARDVLGLADALEIKRFAYCGISLGGFVGQWLGANSAARVSHLILANTSPHVGPPSNWDARRQAVFSGGMHKLEATFLERSFSPQTVARHDPRVDSLRRTFLGTNPVGYAGCCAAIRDMNHTGLLHDIHVPTLVIAGYNDISTPWEGHGEVLAREIPDTRSVRLGAAHLSNIERPQSFTAAIFDFLWQAPPDPLQAGEKVRRAVLGNAHVDGAIAKTTDFNRDFQALITRYGWGAVWTRPGLDQRTRRLLALAMMGALGRWEEFRMHVRTGLAHELELPDLKETLLEMAIYAGVPAANTGFQIAREEQAAQKKPL